MISLERVRALRAMHAKHDSNPNLGGSNSVSFMLDMGDVTAAEFSELLAFAERRLESGDVIRESEYGESGNNFHIRRSDDTLSVELTYPPYTDGDNEQPRKVRYVDVNQESVRASDGIRLHYDYGRDGWVVQQASTFQWEIDDPVCDPNWQEVGFFQSWAREKGSE